MPRSHSVLLLFLASVALRLASAGLLASVVLRPTSAVLLASVVLLTSVVPLPTSVVLLPTSVVLLVNSVVLPVTLLLSPARVPLEGIATAAPHALAPATAMADRDTATDVMGSLSPAVIAPTPVAAATTPTAEADALWFARTTERCGRRHGTRFACTGVRDLSRTAHISKLAPENQERLLTCRSIPRRF
jgi:hypothetical protein